MLIDLVAFRSAKRWPVANMYCLNSNKKCFPPIKFDLLGALVSKMLMCSLLSFKGSHCLLFMPFEMVVFMSTDVWYYDVDWYFLGPTINGQLFLSGGTYMPALGNDNEAWCYDLVLYFWPHVMWAVTKLSQTNFTSPAHGSRLNWVYLWQRIFLTQPTILVITKTYGRVHINWRAACMSCLPKMSWPSQLIAMEKIEQT